MELELLTSATLICQGKIPRFRIVRQRTTSDDQNSRGEFIVVSSRGTFAIRKLRKLYYLHAAARAAHETFTP